MAAILRSAYGFYNRQYQARPILTICTTNALLAGISDVITQKYISPSASTSNSKKQPVEISPTATVKATVTNGSVKLAQERRKEVALELVQDIKLNWHGPKDGESVTEDDIKAQMSPATEEADIGASNVIIHMSQEETNTPENEKEIVSPNTTEVAATPPINYPRLGRFMLYNFSVAPLVHTWYSFLDKHIPLATPVNTISSKDTTKVVQSITPVVKRMAADQIFFAPLGLALIFSALTVLEGGGAQQVKEKLNNAYIPTLMANYMVWPIVQLVNFGVMPLQFRLPFVSAVGIAWNAYLSLANSRGAQKQLSDSETSALELAT